MLSSRSPKPLFAKVTKQGFRQCRCKLACLNIWTSLSRQQVKLYGRPPPQFLQSLKIACQRNALQCNAASDIAV